MKKTILMFALVTAVSGFTVAQKEKKYEKLYYKNVKQDVDKYTVEVDNAVSTAGETKFKLKITNKTADYIIFKPEECTFIVNGKTSSPKEKWLIVKPFSSDFKTINLKGADYNRVKSYSFAVDGIYTASPKGTVFKAEDFKLPPSKNDFTAGPFTCTLDKLYKETDRTDVKFKVTYDGGNVAFVNPAKAAAKMPDGNEYAAKYLTAILGNSSPLLLMRGDKDSFLMSWDRMEGGSKMDMQLVEMNIIWHETFTEAPLIKEKGTTVNLEFDQAVSDAKN